MTTPAAVPLAFDEILGALQRSHDRLATALDRLRPEDVARGSYCRDWTVAQVVSHIGSGSEIFTLYLDAGRDNRPAPLTPDIQPIWDRWNAKSPGEQVRDGVLASAGFLERLESTTTDERDTWRLDLFGTVRTLPELARMRLSEHAVHTWDIVVVFDPTATVAGDAIAVIVDSLAPLVQWTAKHQTDPVTVRVATNRPERGFLLELNEGGSRLSAQTSSATNAQATLTAPAEAFVRLVYGRLDAGHTPASVTANGVDIDTLRGAFPGF